MKMGNFEPIAINFGGSILKRFFVISVFLLFFGSIFSVNAQDLIILSDGNVIEARVTEISPTEIRYRRIDHLDGPIIVIARADVISIRYENGTVEVINPERNQSDQQQISQFDTSDFSPSGEPTLLQQVLNQLPAVRIAGNNLKFEFSGETWTARVNGENFSAGTVEFESTAEGGVLTLKQTHIWPGAVGRTAGRVANVIPGGGAASSALTTAGNIAGAVGAVEMPGTEIILEYNAGPPTSLKLLSVSGNEKRTVRDPTVKSANSRDNWISFELAFMGIGARYERMLGSKISLGANVYWFPDPITDEKEYEYFEINTFFRFYPAGNIFFLGIGLGYHHFFNYLCYNPDQGLSSRNYHTVNGFVFIPEIGWKIDIGQAGSFYLMPCISIAMVQHVNRFLYYRSFYLGMGYAF